MTGPKSVELDVFISIPLLQNFNDYTAISACPLKTSFASGVHFLPIGDFSAKAGTQFFSPPLAFSSTNVLVHFNKKTLHTPSSRKTIETFPYIYTFYFKFQLSINLTYAVVETSVTLRKIP